jgi:hypothetical protein
VWCFAAGGNYKSIAESVSFGGFAASASVDLKVHEFMGGVRYQQPGEHSELRWLPFSGS